MGVLATNISLPNGFVPFLLAQKTNPKKGTLPNASARKQSRPSLGKEADTLFYWLVLRTPPYALIMSVLQKYNPIVHIKLV